MKNLLALIILVFCMCSLTFGQTYDKKFTDRIKKRKKNDPESFIGRTVEYAPIGVPGDISFRTASLPISFSRLERDSADNWRIGSSITLGSSYIWGWGNGTLNADSTITTEPHFFFGPTGNFGVSQDQNDITKLSPSLTLGVIVGFSSFAAMFGVDVLNETPIIGIAYNISGFPLLKNLTRFNDYPTKKIGK